jgi:hypothetical protein
MKMTSPIDPSYNTAMQDVQKVSQDLQNPKSGDLNADLNKLQSDMTTVYNNAEIPDSLKQSLNQSIQALPTTGFSWVKMLSGMMSTTFIPDQAPQYLNDFLNTNMKDVSLARNAFQKNPNPQTLNTLQTALQKSQSMLGAIIGRLASAPPPSGISTSQWQVMQRELGGAYWRIGDSLNTLSTNGVNTQVASLNIGSSTDSTAGSLFGDLNVALQSGTPQFGG